MAQVTVERGDSLTKIAKRMYGDANRWREIAQANGIANPNQINAGQVLKLPGMDSDQGRADAQRMRQQAVKRDLAMDGGGGPAPLNDQALQRLPGSEVEVARVVAQALRKAGWTTPDNSWTAPKGWRSQAGGPDNYKILEGIIGHPFAKRGDRRAVAEAFIQLGLDPETWSYVHPENIPELRKAVSNPRWWGE